LIAGDMDSSAVSSAIAAFAQSAIGAVPAYPKPNAAARPRVAHIDRAPPFWLMGASPIWDQGFAIEPEDFGMASMDDRKDAFEKKFAHDEELKFKAMARRNMLLGLWAAEKLGKTGDAAEAYAKEVVISDFEEAGDDDVFRKLRGDFDAAGVQQSDHQIRRTMDELLEVAIDQIRNA
jgi:hypothetical protein